MGQRDDWENCFILENNVLQPFSRIGNNVTLWSGNHIGHRTVVKNHVFISSHCVISGFCEIRESCFLGVNATIGNNVTLSEDNFIGMGSVISKNTTEDGLYVGNPATRQKLGAKKFCKVKDEA
jgi:carbonic anhydrase/acetyltransferase-like protein (isoleucine patch superfamily)